MKKFPAGRCFMLAGIAAICAAEDARYEQDNGEIVEDPMPVI